MGCGEQRIFYGGPRGKSNGNAPGTIHLAFSNIGKNT